MSIVKSISVAEGDMFYIKHGSDNFTIIDCFMIEESREKIINEVMSESQNKGVTRFISTHPDDDHIRGLAYLDDEINLRNFYCVENSMSKSDETIDFKRYRELRDNSDKVFHLYKGCRRKWLNDSDDTRGSSGLTILWPNPDSAHY